MIFKVLALLVPAVTGMMVDCIPELSGMEAVDLGATCNSPYYNSDFNVISFNNFLSQGGDVEGRLFVKNDATMGPNGFSVGMELHTQAPDPKDFPRDYSLIVGGELCYMNGFVYPSGDPTIDKWPASQENVLTASPVSAAPGCNPEYIAGRINFRPECEVESAADALQTYYRDLCVTWAGMAPTMTWEPFHGGIRFKGNGASNPAGIYFVTIPTADWNAAGWTVFIDHDPLSDVVITLTGSEDVVFRGGELPGIPGKAVFNIPGSRGVTVDGGMVGSINAPDALYNQPQGVTRGYLILGDVAHLHQANKPDCPTNPASCPCCHLCGTQEPVESPVLSALSPKNAFKHIKDSRRRPLN